MRVDEELKRKRADLLVESEELTARIRAVNEQVSALDLMIAIYDPDERLRFIGYSCIPYPLYPSPPIVARRPQNIDQSDRRPERDRSVEPRRAARGG